MPTQEDLAFYQALDRRYQDPNYLMARRLQIVVQRVKPGHRLLDIGAGSGIASRRLANHFDQVVSLDRNQNALHFLREQTSQCSNISTICSDGRAPGLRDQVFDCCLLLDVLEHVHNPDEILHQVWRCLRPGAQLLVSTPNWTDFISCKILRMNPYHVTFHTPGGWKALTEQAGFRVIMLRAIRVPLIDVEALAGWLRFFAMGVVMEARKVERSGGICDAGSGCHPGV